ncbi:Gp49 family protein [Mesorhizobium qingshengii]|uniref:Gp49 family protein n=1 Tax=Mesorhizobium qingshengii TaxID=1165689 RepID=A0ABT4QU79_9HYPH|nr:Gp49 family protein [Mesorhizobium qingshengii]MCZ8545059.1 Gp49 family protein [Mesorhizobium qingshengii]
MKTTGSLEAGDAAAAAVAKTDKRVTLASMEGKVETAQFFNPTCAPQLTICVMTLTNGFTLVGKSAPADPANFNSELGEKFAREDAIRQMWPLEGYLLREELSKRVDVGV